MFDYSGKWRGTISGTNTGEVVLNISQSGASVFGTGTIKEPRLGPYEYAVEGFAAENELNAELRPVSASPGLRLGAVRITARALKSGELEGIWTSAVGTSGHFHIRRERSASSDRPDKRPRHPDGLHAGSSLISAVNSLQSPKAAEEMTSNPAMDDKARGPAIAGFRKQGLSTSPQQALRRLKPEAQIDSYVLQKRLGKGGSGEVWKAVVARDIPGVDLSVGDEVALKFYGAFMSQGLESIRIQREFYVAAEAEHPNLARVYDLVLSPSRPFHTFMAMEFVPGETLKSRIQRSGALNREQTIQIALQIFGALEQLHSLGAIHRDVKAANIMLGTKGRGGELVVKLVDLGIVSLLHDDGGAVTAPSVFLGSKHSAPLEQLTGRMLNEQTDIYGAGSVLFHCVRGMPMYAEIGPEGAIVERMLTRPDVIAISGGKDQFADFVNRCVSVDPSRRPATAAECLRELRELR